MGKSCCEGKSDELVKLREKQGRVLKIVLAVNAVMFLVEFVSGWIAKSSALQADSLDMLGDALVYGFSLYVLHRSASWKATAALLKGSIIVGFALFVLVSTTMKVITGTVPAYETMGAVGVLALAANALCLYLLYSHRRDDINMRSTYICSRNDILSNSAVLFAALGVSLTGSGWPDIAVGYGIAILFLGSAWPILREAISTLRRGEAPLAQ